MYGILQPGPDVAAGVPYVRPTEIQGDEIQLGDIRRTSPEIAAQYKRASLKTGDVLLSIVGTIGKVALVPAELEGGNITQSSVRIRPGPVTEAAFIRSLLKSPQLISQYDRLRLGTGVPRLNVGDVRELQCPLPPLNEQRRIVAKLETLQARSRRAREALDALPPLLEKLRQSILAAAFRGDLTKDWRAKHKDVEPASELLKRIRAERRKKWEEAELAKMRAKGKAPTDDKWKGKYKEPAPVDAAGLPGLPEGWCWASPREVVAWASGDFLPRSAQVDGPYPVYGGNGVSGSHAEFLVATPTVVVGRVGADCGNVHVTLGPSWVTDNAIYAGIVPPSLNLAYWLLALSRSDLRSQARGGGQPFVSQETLNGLLVPVPPEVEQAELVSLVRALESRLRALEENAQTQRVNLTELDRATLAKAFRGELVPQDPNDEPGEAMLARVRGASAEPVTTRQKKLSKRLKPQSRLVDAEKDG